MAYNGWKNWHTWNAYNWLSSDYSTTKDLEKRANEMEASELKEIWKTYFEGTDGIETEKINFTELLKAFAE